MPKVNGTPSDSAGGFADAARALQAQRSLVTTLQTICELAVQVSEGDHAAITTLHDGTFRTVASTSHVPHVVDQIQYDSNEGPCVDAIRDELNFRTGDLSRESRWPTFAPLAAKRTGVHSMLAHRLFLREGTLGALNIYAHRRNAFRPEIQVMTGIFATHASVALAAAQDHDRADNLEGALSNSRRIGMAMGILMHTEGMTEDEAFAALSKRSQDTNQRLSRVAEELAYTGSWASDAVG